MSDFTFDRSSKKNYGFLKKFWKGGPHNGHTGYQRPYRAFSAGHSTAFLRTQRFSRVPTKTFHNGPLRNLVSFRTSTFLEIHKNCRGCISSETSVEVATITYLTRLRHIILKVFTGSKFRSRRQYEWLPQRSVLINFTMIKSLKIFPNARLPARAFSKETYFGPNARMYA